MSMGILTLMQKFRPMAEMPCLPVTALMFAYFNLERSYESKFTVKISLKRRALS